MPLGLSPPPLDVEYVSLEQLVDDVYKHSRIPTQRDPSQFDSLRGSAEYPTS